MRSDSKTIVMDFITLSSLNSHQDVEPYYYMFTAASRVDANHISIFSYGLSAQVGPPSLAANLPTSLRLRLRSHILNLFGSD